MSVLVAYASKYGATREIAERIAETLRAAGQEAEARSIKDAGDPASYDAFVVGSAVYFGSWLGEAAAFVRGNQDTLAGRPVWLFSSGPIGTERKDAEGRDVREAAVPKEIAEFQETIHPRDHRVFYGKLDRSYLGFMHRLIVSLPAFPGAEGDFRDWPDIEDWAASIARDLARVPDAHGAPR